MQTLYYRLIPCNPSESDNGKSTDDFLKVKDNEITQNFTNKHDMNKVETLDCSRWLNIHVDDGLFKKYIRVMLCRLHIYYLYM